MVILIVIILLLYIQPNFLINFSNTLIGKAIFITLIILTTLQHNTCGLLLAVLFIILLEYNFEGLTKEQKKKDEWGDVLNGFEGINDGPTGGVENNITEGARNKRKGGNSIGNTDKQSDPEQNKDEGMSKKTPHEDDGHT